VHCRKEGGANATEKKPGAGNPKIRPSFFLIPFHMRPGPISLTMSLTFARSTKVEIIKKKRLGLTLEITRLSFNKDIFDVKNQRSLMTKEPLLLLFGSFFTLFIRQKEGIRSKRALNGFIYLII